MDQAELKKMYEEQQTAVGAAVLQNKEELVCRFNKIIDSPALKVNRVEKVINVKTGEIFYYAH